MAKSGQLEEELKESKNNHQKNVSIDEQDAKDVLIDDNQIF